MFMTTYNAMMEGFANQIDNQIGKRLFTWNRFPGMTQRPRLTISKIDKTLSPAEIGKLLGPLTATMPLGDDDIIAIRKALKFLPEQLPEINSTPEPEPPASPEDEPAADEEPTEPTDEQVDEETRQQAEDMAAQTARWQRYLLQHPEALIE